jgi:hypothetical protein
MRYVLYILGFAATLIAVFARTRNPEEGDRLTGAGYLALSLALAVMLAAMLGTCRDQRTIRDLAGPSRGKISTIALSRSPLGHLNERRSGPIPPRTQRR